MDPRRILAKAETWKRRAHRLSLDLRLRSVTDAKKFLREHGVALWNDRGELPNILDALIGRIANGRERVRGKAAENCFAWRGQLLQDPEFLECPFFNRQPTVVYQELWPYVTVVARLNRGRAETEPLVSRDARKVLNFVAREGPVPSTEIRRALKFTSIAEGHIFHRAKKELQNMLIVLVQTPERKKKTRMEILDLWENRMPKAVRSRADQYSEKDAKSALLGATLNSCIISKERKISRWFRWNNESLRATLESLLQKKDFIRIRQRKNSWIVPRKVLSLKS